MQDKTADSGLGGRARLWQAGAVESYPMSAEASLSTLANPGQPFYPFNQQGQYEGARFSGEYARISGEYPRHFATAEEPHPDAAPSTSGRSAILSNRQPFLDLLLMFLSAPSCM